MVNGRSPCAAAARSRRRRVGDERAHVGADEQSDGEGRARAVAFEHLEAGDGDLALGELDGLAAAREAVGPLAADLHRAERRRALGDRAGGQQERLAGMTPVSVISPSGSPVLDTAPKRATAT